MKYNAEHLDALKTANELRKYFHTALWEEEKHYTWLVSIILGSITLVITRETEYKAPIIFLLAVVGFVITRIAIAVIKAESRYFQIAIRRHIALENLVFVGDENGVPDKHIDDESKRELWERFIYNKKVSIRSAFIFTFIFFEAVFIFVGLISLIYTLWMVAIVNVGFIHQLIDTL
ncbi:MAG: hypothetical protein JXR25_15915 [Pontiellaceae bacterium]|nr:hypothetical protein [Pontiellaceae bacterium]MBN2786307.1 hypothetical protein [Pontiellaceae bacterium]